jgi:hypothetical protein
MMTTQRMKKCSGLLWVVLILMGVSTQRASARAIRDSSADIRALLGKVQQAYHSNSYLSFRIKYLYANEGQPGSSNMDSLAGEVEMHKNRCRFVIDGTETVLTDKYAIQVMNEDKAIYLSAIQHTGLSNPVAMLDSVFAHIQGIHIDLQHQGLSEMLTLRFPPGSAYSLIRMQVDARTGYFQKISYSLYTVGLVGEELIDRPGHPGPYQSRGQVTVVFSQYEHGRFDDSLFREENFFSKTAGRFEPARRYNDYHIFLASSNL